MSKSDISEYSRILMTDSNDEISIKIKKAKTDPMNMPSSSEEASNRPEIDNLLNIYCACSGKDKDIIISDFSGKEISNFKNDLTKVIISVVEPIAIKTKEFLNDPGYLDNILKKGSDSARKIAKSKIEDLYKIIGMSE
jgi:tryptophanyl-tRNA synthetase